MPDHTSRLIASDASLLQSYINELASLLGVPGVQLSESEVKAFGEHLEKAYHVGQVAGADAIFLYVLSRLIPTRSFVEIGTASGFSTMLIAMALQANPENAAGVQLHSIDRKAMCLFDDTKQVGFVAINGQALVPKVQLHFHRETDSFQARELVRPKASLAFIDGNHQHPWPLQDILNLLPVLEPGAWVALHDTDLPAIARQLQVLHPEMNAEARFGPQYLFKHWPGRKVDGGNVGLVQVPLDVKTLEACTELLLELPFETPGDNDSRKRKIRSALAKAGA